MLVLTFGVPLLSRQQQQQRERELRKQHEREQRRRYEEMEQLRREEERRHAEREQVHTFDYIISRLAQVRRYRNEYCGDNSSVLSLCFHFSFLRDIFFRLPEILSTFWLSNI